MLEQWELANYKPEYNFVVRKYDIGKGYSVSVLWRGGEVDTIYGFEREHDALEWIREKSQGWLLDQRRSLLWGRRLIWRPSTRRLSPELRQYFGNAHMRQHLQGHN